jgi:pSer/pThr/pTyr-binding forkhead associated (FHA) protein
MAMHELEAVLVVREGKDKDRSFPLKPGVDFQLGRGDTTPSRLTDLTVSREHCQVRFDGEKAILTNLSSKGTKINRKPVTGPTVLQTGDLIFLGKTMVEYLVGSPHEVSTRMGSLNLGSSFPLAAQGSTLENETVSPGAKSRWMRSLVGVGIGLALLVGVGAAYFGMKQPTETHLADNSKSTSGEQARSTDLPDNPPPTKETTGNVHQYHSSGRLLVLAVGVSRYKDGQSNLTVADKDAIDLTKALRSQKGLYADVLAKQLLNEQATRENIIVALENLRKQATQNDLVIVSFSGHGEARDNEYFFLPHDYKNSSIAATGLDWFRIRTELLKMPCCVVLLLDTCHSGEATREMRGTTQERGMRQNAVNRLVGEQGRGLFVITACMGQEKARESKKWGHGALTLAVLEALENKVRVKEGTPPSLPPVATLGPARCLVLYELNNYVTRRVQQLTNGAQAVISNHTGNIDPLKIPIAPR